MYIHVFLLLWLNHFLGIFEKSSRALCCRGQPKPPAKLTMRAIGKSRRAWFDGHSDGRRIQDFTMPHVLYIRIGPGAVTVTTTGQHKRSTTKMLQIWFISNKKSQHIAIFKSDFFPLPLRKLQRAIPIWMLHPTTSERAGWHESCYCLDCLHHVFLPS